MKKMRERTELTEKGQQRRLMLLSAAIMIFVAQLDLNLIINGFRISLAVICLPVMSFLSSNFPVFPVTLIAAPGILLVRCSGVAARGQLYTRILGIFPGDAVLSDVRRTVCVICPSGADAALFAAAAVAVGRH